MATRVIPGSYPLDDSAPATPDDTTRQSAEQLLRHQRRDVSHEANDFRRHKHTDSGVGLADPEPIYSVPGEYLRESPSEAAGRRSPIRDHIPPLEPVGAELNIVPPASPQDVLQDAEVSKATGSDKIPDAVGGTPETSKPDSVRETGQRRQVADAGAHPYWGDLPKTAGDRVYNTITGRGSASDDNSERNHPLPQRSASSEPSRITGAVTDYPRGGVYNTVAGRGSQDAEARRHGLTQGSQGGDGSSDNSSVAVAHDPFECPFAVPLPDIPEEDQKSPADKPDIAPGFLPEADTRDDVLLAEYASRHAGSKPSPPPSVSPQRSSTHSTQRAFPLVGSTTGPRAYEQKSRPPSQSGIAAAGGPKADDVPAIEATNDGSRASASSSPRSGQGQAHSSAGDATTQQGQNEKHRSPVELTGRADGAHAKGEKRHSILGIFHRHHGSSKEQDASHRHHRKSRRDRSPLPTQDGTQDVVASGSPNRLRKRSKGEGSEDRKISPPVTTGDTHHPGGSKGKAAAAGTAAGTGLVFGPLPRKKEEDDDDRDLASHTPPELADVPTPFEHPRQAPVPPQLPARDTHARDSGGAEPGRHDSLPGGTPSRAKTPATSNADEKPGRKPTANGTVVSREPGDYNVLVSSGAPPAEENALSRPAQADPTLTTHPQTADVSAHEYNTLQSGTPSGVKAKDAQRRPDADRNHPPRPSPDLTGTTPRPEPVQKNVMSPEVMPAAYLASPRQQQQQQQQQQQPTLGGLVKHYQQQKEEQITAFPHPELVQHMSPEVMPECYTASVPRRRRESKHGWNGNGNGSGGGAAGAPGGRPGNVVMHRCRHCGGEEDISGLLAAREGM